MDYSINYEGQNSEIVATYILKELDYEILHSLGLEKRKMVLGLDYVGYSDKKINAHYRKIVGNLKTLQRNNKEEREKRFQEWKQEQLKEYPNMRFIRPSRFRKIKLAIGDILHAEFGHSSVIGDILCRKEGKGYLFDVKLKMFKENKNLNQFGVTDNEVLNYDHLTKSGKVPVKILINLKKDDGYYYGIFDWSEFKYSKNYDPHKTMKTSIRLKDGFDVSKLKKFENVRNYKFEQYLDIAELKRKNAIRNEEFEDSFSKQ